MENLKSKYLSFINSFYYSIICVLMIFISHTFGLELLGIITVGVSASLGLIISNNLNIVMKFLTSIAIIFAIPTMFSSFWGMNVAVPFASNEFGFLIVSIISLVAAIAAAIFFAKKGMF